MSIDRSKFKPSSVQKMQESDSSLNDTLGKSGLNSRAGMLKITNGKNVFRIYPAHPEDSLSEENQPSFSQPCVRTFLPMMLNVRDESGKETGEKKEGYKPIFNSKVHGNTTMDIVEEYIKLARSIADSELKGTEKQAFLDKIYGKYSKNAAERQMGIRYKTSYVMYADKIVGSEREFGRLEVKESVKTRMNQIAASESEGEALGVDPFTDLDDGRAIVINYDEASKTPSGYYITSLDTDIDKTTKMAKFYPIDDEMLEKFAEHPSLYSLYCNVFSRKDFELQLEGLEFFDNKYKMGVFSREQFLSIVEEVSDQLPNSDNEDSKPQPIDSRQDDEDDEEEDDEEGDEFSTMSREDLKKYIVKQSLGIVVKKSYDTEKIAQLVREAVEFNKKAQGPLEEFEEEPNEEPNEEESTKAKQQPKTTPSSRLAGLRSRLQS